MHILICIILLTATIIYDIRIWVDSKTMMPTEGSASTVWDNSYLFSRNS